MTKPTRYRDWQSRFADFVVSRESEPFAWGSNDCALCACDGIEAISGHDPAADVRGYDSAIGAARVVEALGGMSAICATRFGEEIPPAMAQVCDVGLAVLDGRETMVLCGGRVWLGPGPNGLERLPLSAVSRAWRCF